MDRELIIQRLQRYCLEHKSIVQNEMIKGINFETEDVILEKKDIIRQLPIELLEDNMFDFDKFTIKAEADLAKYDILIGQQGVKWGNDGKIIELPRNLKELLEISPLYQDDKMDYIVDNFNDVTVKDIEQRYEIFIHAFETLSNIQSECQKRNIDFEWDILSCYDIMGRKIDK